MTAWLPEMILDHKLNHDPKIKVVIVALYSFTLDGFRLMYLAMGKMRFCPHAEEIARLH